MRGRVVIHPGSGPGLSTYRLGQTGGVETVTLSLAQMPSHNHAVNAVSDLGDSNVPTDNFLSRTWPRVYSTGGTSVTMDSAMIANAGGSQAHTNIQPFVTMNCIIAIEGTFPSRN